MWDLVFTGVNLATMEEGGAAYGEAREAALGVKDGRIAFAGPAASLPGAPEKLARKVEAMEGAWITPGLVDCHTHLVFGGERSNEFEMRLNGARYEEIARAGGGIVSTVKATRAASLDELVESARPRLNALIEGGATTVEIKSGYGLDVETEIKMLEAATRLGEETGVRLRRTLLALHALPPEFRDDRAGYVGLVCDEILPEAVRRGLVDAVDAFCEGIGFTREEVGQVFEKAASLGVPVKLHAEQLSDLGGAGLAAEYRALSADHLEFVNDDDIRKMAAAGVVAVLLPGAFYFLRETRKPPVEALRREGVRMALATDCNPGSSPIASPSLVMNMACTLFSLTPEEALAGLTRNGAAALGLQGETGVLREGMAADLALWRVSRPAEIAYWIGAARPERVYAAGKEIVRR